MKKSLTFLSMVAGNIMLVAAQVGPSVSTVSLVNKSPIVNLLVSVNEILGRLVPIAVGLAVLGFFWFLIIFIFKAKDNPEDQKKSMSGMGYSILAIFLMVSIWGIIGLLGNMFGIGQGGDAIIPTIPSQRL